MKGLRLLLGLVALCGTVAASQIPAGYLSWDVNFPGNAGQFDITNLTGPNAVSPDFPITTTLNLASLSLDVMFVGGGSTVYSSSYFTLSSDGESFDGTAIPIGGTNPEPVSATLTGTFSPTSINDPGADTIIPSFSVSLSDTPFLVDGDLGIIFATEASTAPGTPEPGTTVLLALGLLALVGLRYRRLAKAVIPALLLCLAASHSAFAQAVLSGATSPSNGVAGVNNVNVTASDIPAGTLTPANVIATFASSCGGTVVTTEGVNSIKKILGSTDRFNINLPATLTTGNYFVSLADSAAGEADFTSTDCSEVQVTASSAVLNACVAGSSIGVLLPAGGATGTVTAYVPKGYWEGNTTGIFIQNIEGTAAPTATVATPNITNSCSSNPATGQTVCVANNTDVYLVSGATLTNTLSSGSNTTASFSGGSCNNCGVAVNANNNTAVINMGLTGSIEGGLQVLNLNTNTFGTPLPLVGADVSENISVDPTRSLVLSAGEGGNYTLAQIQANGSLLEFDSAFGTGIENDSSAEDCSTGVALTPGEFSNSVFLVNMNAITFTAGSPGTYTAPNALATLVTDYSFAAGLSGSAVAQGSGHLAVVTGEFGGSTFAVLKLPAATGNATPALVDYAVAAIPSSTACGGFTAGFDPHTITAYTSPNTGDSYAVFAGYSGTVPVCLAVVDMSTVINPTLTPRGGGGLQAHDVAAADLPASAVTFFPL